MLVPRKPVSPDWWSPTDALPREGSGPLSTLPDWTPRLVNPTSSGPFQMAQFASTSGSKSKGPVVASSREGGLGSGLTPTLLGVHSWFAVEPRPELESSKWQIHQKRKLPSLRILA